MKETFKVSVINTKTQSRTNIDSTAETLGQLKAELSDAGVDYDGMTFMEGSTKTELKTNDSILPTNVPVKRNGVATGETTNDLVFFLTAPDKHISSGNDREAAYDFFRANPDVAEKVKKELGRHYTNLSTATLVEYINKYKTAAAKVVKTATKKSAPKSNVFDNIKKFVGDLFQKGVLTEKMHRHLRKYLMARIVQK